MRYFLAMMLLFVPWLAQAQAVPELESRDAWQMKQKVIRIQAHARVSGPTFASRDFLIASERTPQGRFKIILRDAASHKVLANFLQQEGTSMVLTPDGAVGFPAAPWLPGALLLGNRLEPAMVFSWLLGVPGPSFSVEQEPAKIMMADHRLSGIQQDGWNVSYAQWNKSERRPSLPGKVIVRSDSARMEIQVESVEAFAAPPSDYHQFEIR